MQENVPVNCRSCEREVLMKDIKFDSTTNSYICERCYDKNRKSSEQEMSVKKDDMTSKPDLENYLCKNCNYEFSRKKSRTINECPYCGKNDLLVK